MKVQFRDKAVFCKNRIFGFGLLSKSVVVVVD